MLDNFVLFSVCFLALALIASLLLILAATIYCKIKNPQLKVWQLFKANFLPQKRKKQKQQNPNQPQHPINNQNP